VPSFLTNADLRLLLFGGKGGVGKTTCATATAVRLARERPDRQLLVLSTDPAHSLKDSLSDVALPATLQAVEFDAQEYLVEFRRRHGQELQAIAERGTFLDGEDIRRFLSLSLPGMDELFAFLDIARRAVSTGGQPLTIVDTAPTGHALRLLAMSGLLRRWVSVLESLLAKHRYMKQLFTHRYVPDELDRFLTELSRSIDAAEGLLTDPDRCRFVPVMIAEELSIRETTDLLQELDQLRIPARDIVVNMIVPASSCAHCAGARALQERTLHPLPAVFRGRRLWELPLRDREVRGEEIETLWSDAAPLRTERNPAGVPAVLPMPREPVQEPSALPRAALRLIMVGGKGGVGKTTLACATAIRLAHESPERRILLLSTDPAHSVGDCLDQPVGPQPTPVFGRLTAMEMDASAELDALKRQYREELDEFFGSMLKGFDVPFDRQVMEGLIELSPPGLDEIMALAGAMDLLAEDRCDQLILDTAPTGHFLRLLELPELISSWLKAFFELFLKYRDIFGIPAFSERLVRLSRELHRFRALLRDPHQAALYVVSVPTRMALEETQDLLAACRRMSVNVPILFLNRMTPGNDCPFCRARAREERETTAAFRRAFGRHVTRVFRQPEPRGIGRLEELGQQLYQNEAQGGRRVVEGTS
jgi:arsenite-transporting ATPase